MAEKKPLILDIHIPYCVRPERCQDRYFLTGTNEEKNAYMAALKREVLSCEGELDGYEIRAVRLSGGSATVMSPDLLGDLLRTVREHLPVARGVEISVDAHLLTIGTPALTGIATGHPTRMELLVHSDDDSELEALDCSFRRQHVQNALLFYHRFRIHNAGVRISYGIPGQTPLSWKNTLHAMTIMRPVHITVKPVNGGLAGETMEEMYQIAVLYLKENGYLQYSDSHFALAHYGWLYELLDMDASERLGFGVGACSACDDVLSRNTNNIRLYLQNAGEVEKVTVQASPLTDDLNMEDYLFRRLHSTDGLDPGAFAARFGRTLPGELENRLGKAEQRGLLVTEEGRYRPTGQGLFVHNTGGSIITV